MTGDVVPQTTQKTGPEPAVALSVIIPSVNSYDDLDGCLRALETRQGAAHPAQKGKNPTGGCADL